MGCLIGNEKMTNHPHLFGKSKTKYDFCGSGLPYRRWLKMWWCITEGLASQGCLDSNGAGLPMQWDRVGEGKRRIFYPKKIWHEFGNVWRNKFWIKCHIIIFDPKKIMADFWGILWEKKRLIIFKIGWVGVGGAAGQPLFGKTKKNYQNLWVHASL